MASISHAAELSRIREFNPLPDRNEAAWAMGQQQQQMRTYEQGAAWANEFGTAPQINSAGPSMQQNMLSRPDSTFFYLPPIKLEFN